MGRDGRTVCRRCGASMRYVGKAPPAPNGHHASLFYCPQCDREYKRG